ncbi:hypothetical protein B0S90_0774 [Caldicellulosiruptor bescii]|uniref:Uncharacterized protein n=3 Tax=Caldicellulosiruptor TaxID=44000 RepID=B9MNU4_CALBD|nr:MULTISPECIES: hypothetical protein [Caldicellulosiruptor]ACM59623.1 hypothetical protein Athe_0497 [Caldicellulosiruptor bescii DSM 6725]ADQ46992.1 hypothetical protein Calkro_2151 [Caldicellulosiruptor kronotskyensis 2002]PBC89647.1 hypothetical protein B0S87_2776 [Caldicellulosiruptor bescii]PBC89970.1 hypothetical protein B0S89_0278 [Caldicellulosiruptor bescii]PBD04599.1 hypothetical protein B0S85_2270 [Caldicellulosiruptor bescii]
MKRKIIYIHIVFLVIIALILSIFYKNYSVKRTYFVRALENMKSIVSSEIRETTWFTNNIIYNFDKYGFSMENVLFLKSKVEFVSYIIEALKYIDIDSLEILDYNAKLNSMYWTFLQYGRFLSKVIEYIKDGGKPFNLFDNNDNKFLIKTKKDIYNEFLLYHDLFSKLDLHVTKSSTGTELFNKIIKTWDIEKANKIVYPSERN